MIDDQTKFSPVMGKPKRERKHNFKFLTFLSGLLNLGLCAILGIVIVILAGQYTVWMATSASNVILSIFLLPLAITFGLLCVCGVFLYFILGALLLVASFGKDKKYANWKALIITTIVIDFLLGISGVLLIFVLSTALSQQAFVIFVVMIAMTLLSALLKILDLILHKRRYKSVASNKDIEGSTVMPENNAIDFSVLKSDATEKPKTKKQNSIKNIDDIEKIDIE